MKFKKINLRIKIAVTTLAAVMLMQTIVFADTQLRDIVEILVHELVQEYREHLDFNLAAALEPFGYDIDDFVQYIYRGANDFEIASMFAMVHGGDWLVYMIELTLLDLKHAFAEHDDETMAIVLYGIFDWAWEEAAVFLDFVDAFAVLEDLEVRFALDLRRNVAGSIQTVIAGANLNIFVKNESNQTIYFEFHIFDYYGDAYEIRAEIAPGADFVRQLPPDKIDGKYFIFGLHGADAPEISGEFAFRFTHFPLGHIYY